MRQAEYARYKGWSRQYVGKLKKTGRLVLVGDLIDAVATEAILAETADPARELPAIGRGEAPASLPVEAAVERRDDQGTRLLHRALRSEEEADAKLKQLDLAERLRTVVARARGRGRLRGVAGDGAARGRLDRRRLALAETVAGGGEDGRGDRCRDRGRGSAVADKDHR